MNTTLSTKFQIVIPKEVRLRIGWKPGLKLMVIPEIDGSIKLFPVKTKTIKDLYGFVKGMDTTIEREPDREL